MDISDLVFQVELRHIFSITQVIQSIVTQLARLTAVLSWSANSHSIESET